MIIKKLFLINFIYLFLYLKLRFEIFGVIEYGKKIIISCGTLVVVFE